MASIKVFLKLLISHLITFVFLGKIKKNSQNSRKTIRENENNDKFKRSQD